MDEMAETLSPAVSNVLGMNEGAAYTRLVVDGAGYGPARAGLGKIARVVCGGWNPDAFVDLVEEVHDSPPDDVAYVAAVRLQQLEWHLLFDHCVATARGAA